MIILTGGAGFIGSCFLWKLNSQGIKDILIVDNLGKNEKWKNLLGKKFTDYMHKDNFIKLIKEDKFTKVDFIIHLGACSSTILDDAEYYMNNNYRYSKILAKWAIKRDIPFIYASSGATYGNGEFGFKDDKDTTFKLKPLNMYGFSKNLFDTWIFENNLENKVIGFKFFNVFGPNEYHKGEMCSVVGKKFKEVQEQDLIYLFKSYNKDYKDGSQKRDFIYIKDVIEVMFWFFKNFNKTGIYNLGTGCARTWNDLAYAMFKALNKKPKIEYINMPLELIDKYQYYTEADICKLEKSGCNINFSSLEDSVKDYICYLKDKSYL